MEINAAMKRLKKVRIFGTRIRKGRERKEGQARDLGGGRRFGEMSRALMMGEGFKYVLSVPSRERKDGNF